MAPRKRKAQQEEEAIQVQPSTASVRVTRSAARLAESNSSATVAELPKPKVAPKKTKKAKAAGKGKRKKTEEKGEEAETEIENVEEKEEDPSEDDDDATKKTVVVEHCKQCNSFKTRAIQVKKGLENGVPGITVLLNPDKPRRGCFEIREEGGETFISLLGMKRPFKPMKDLDMDKVISDIIDKIK
ncbi:selenoprotein H [Quillaja saponaria]|uniref:Selenoprotein H n=1 Tax=Quillaja saponaria TaxID=32244 RepID=A0AAD7LJW7_QUISA|nr:selenoprotein H [Quillaja saponaria]